MPTRRTNQFAVASLVCAIAGVLVVVGPFLGIVFGFVARNQIKRSGYVEDGAGMALAGIIIGFSVIAVWVILLLWLLFSLAHQLQ